MVWGLQEQSVVCVCVRLIMGQRGIDGGTKKGNMVTHLQRTKDGANSTEDMREGFTLKYAQCAIPKRQAEQNTQHPKHI